jgi:uncharacterized protein CA_C3713
MTKSKKENNDMPAISLTPEQLKSEAQTYTNASEQLKDAINKVSGANGRLQGQWQGAAFQSYLEQFQQLSVSVTQMEQLLESIHAQLNQYADTVAERDRQDAASFGLN